MKEEDKTMCTLYFDCSKGAAGDMIGAALLGLVPDVEEVLEQLNDLGIPGVKYRLVKQERYGIQGNSMVVLVHGEEEDEQFGQAEEHGKHHHKKNSHEHFHMTMKEIREIVERMNVGEEIRNSIMEIYEIIAQAEAKAHQCPVTEVHFHEVGTLDAIADVAATCVILHKLNPKNVFASQICVGNGTVRCAHGILPVPAPATANILSDIPYEQGEIQGEICTPTGAALLRYFVDEFYVPKPDTDIEKEGIGIGKRVFQMPSYFSARLLRA